MRRIAAAGMALFVGSAAAAAPEVQCRLLLLGGADVSPQAMSRFAQWAGGRAARILIVPYATSTPEEYSQSVADQLSNLGPARVEVAVSTATLARSGAAPFLRQLEGATAVFFTGGDQVRLMGVLRRHGLVEALRRRHAEGLPFAGTSAGTAVMSDPMITGEGDFDVIDGSQVETAQGLGLVPGTIVDQHFLKRRRENRLFGAVLARPGLVGLGVDEATAVAVTQGRYLEVLDRGAAMIVRAEKRGEEALLIEILRPGERYDLVARRRLPRG